MKKNGECFVMEHQKGTGRRVLYLDWLKLIAAWLVVFYHLSYYRLDYVFVPDMAYWPNLNRIVMCFASCSVPIFFLVNGALMFHRHRTWKEPVLKASKILVLILVWYLADFPYWFIRTLIILYLLFPILQWLRERYPMLLRLLCLTVFVMPFGYNLALMCLKGLALTHVIPDWTATLTVTGCFTMYSILYFCMGPYLAKCDKWPITSCIAWICVGWFLVVAECVIYTNTYQTVWDGVNSAFPTVGAGLLAVGVFMLVRHLPDAFGEKLLRWAGEGVLAIYLLHMAVIHIMSVEHHPIVIGALMTCLVCAVCICAQKIAKQIPWLNWLFRI